MDALASERVKQKAFWKEHTQPPTVEAMMLDSNASCLDKEERPEILSMLPLKEGQAILELGSGVGRFVPDLAKHAKHLITVDFMEDAVQKSKEVNGRLKNVTFLCADVTTLDLPVQDGSIDIIFSNWLLMYLDDHEMEGLAAMMLRWLRHGGHLFFRESCFHQSGDFKRKSNPSHYRTTLQYHGVFETLRLQETDGSFSRFELVQCKCVNAYVKQKRNQNQICWLWKKVVTTNPHEKSFQQFLDNSQYTQNGILCYERIFGDGFVSTGGFDSTKEFVGQLGLQPGQSVLDVGCGIGGGDFYMAEEFDVAVTGMDLSLNMISIALERAIGRKCDVQFEVADCTTKNFPEASFDVIYSRDTILHIQDKPALFASFFRWLKPGGQLFITDYCRGKKSSSSSEEFLAYVKQRGYDLHEVSEYGKMLQDAGFSNVIAEDRTDKFLEFLQKELERIRSIKEQFVAEFSEGEYDYIVKGWEAKVVRCDQGEQKWGVFSAHK